MKRAMYIVLAVLITLGAQTFFPLSGESEAAQREAPLAGAAAVIEVVPLGSVYPVAVKGIGDENEVIEQKVVQEKGQSVIRKMPGRLKLSDIVIKISVGPLANDFLYKWRRGFLQGKEPRRNGSISFLDATAKPIARYNFFNAWPSQYKGPSLDMQSPQLGLTEEFVLTLEGIERVQ